MHNIVSIYPSSRNLNLGSWSTMYTTFFHTTNIHCIAGDASCNFQRCFAHFANIPQRNLPIGDPVASSSSRKDPTDRYVRPAAHLSAAKASHLCRKPTARVLEALQPGRRSQQRPVSRPSPHYSLTWLADEGISAAEQGSPPPISPELASQAAFQERGRPSQQQVHPTLSADAVTRGIIGSGI